MRRGGLGAPVRKGPARAARRGCRKTETLCLCQEAGFSVIAFGRVQNPPGRIYSESLILAQNERWQRGLGMQVERAAE